MTSRRVILAPYTSAETGTILRVDRKTVTRWALSGLFPDGVAFRTFGGQWRFDRTAIAAVTRGELDLTAGAR